MMHEPYRDGYKDLVRTQENKRVYIDHKAVTESFSRHSANSSGLHTTPYAAIIIHRARTFNGNALNGSSIMYKHLKVIAVIASRSAKFMISQKSVMFYYIIFITRIFFRSLCLHIYVKILRGHVKITPRAYIWKKIHPIH
ncbi:hypothetical protein QTP88_022230 [Uroleucon formosanum]